MHLLLSCALALLCAKSTLADCLEASCPSRCEHCLSISEYEAPGIGFELSLTYGLAAAHHFNGTIQHLPKVAASTEYVSTMKRLARAPAPDASRWDRFKRWYNKRLGRPATPDIGIISRMLSSLKTAAELELQQPLGKVSLAAPRLPSIYQDIRDALDFAGIEYWPFWADSPLIDTTDAVFAGNGNGLCKTPRNILECGTEQQEFPWRLYLTAGFSNETLSTSVMALYAAFRGILVVHQFDFEAGLNWKSNWTTDSAYWDHISERIAELPVSLIDNPTKHGLLNGPIDGIQIHGEQALNKDFRKALRHGLEKVQKAYNTKGMKEGSEFQNLEMYRIVDPEYVAARGVALYSRQRQEMGVDCEEDPNCEQERDEQRKKLGMEAGSDRSRIRVEI